MTALVPPSKQQQQRMRELNYEVRDLRVALNQAQGHVQRARAEVDRANANIERALRLTDRDYQQARREIIEEQGARDGYQWDMKP
jgi:hypothetical protein